MKTQASRRKLPPAGGPEEGERRPEERDYKPLTAEGAAGGLELCHRSAKVNPTVDSIFDLSPSEKLQLVEDLWDDLAGNAGDIPVHNWQKEELARREANLRKNPGSGLTWEEVKRRVRNRHGR